MEASFQRARRPEQKDQRRERILATAAGLARDAGVARVSLGDIAAAVGLAKSNVLRYFGTREEIYLQVLRAEGTDWAAAAGAALDRASGFSAVASALAGAYADRPLYCDLTTHAETMLEHNVSVAALRVHKLWAIDTYFGVGRQITVACPELTDADGAALVMAASAFVAKLFPLTRPPAALRELYEREPEIARVFPPFRPTLQRMIFATAAGLPAAGAGMPAAGAGMPAAGAGMPAAGAGMPPAELPAAGLPAAGLPAAGLPAAGLPTASLGVGHRSVSLDDPDELG